MTAPDLLAILGRLHPLILHLPIGLLAGLAVAELAAILRRRDPGQVLAPLVWLNAAAGVAAAATGFLLSREPGYAGGDTINTHMWLGIAVGVCGVLLAAAYARRLRRPGPGGARLYRLTLACTLALLLPTGHLGGEMTHGAGFVLEPLRNRARQHDLGPSEPAPTAEPAAPLTLDAQAHPLLATYCISCHGATKARGGLALHTPAALARGGDTGPAIVPGHAAASELLRRLRLPPDHDDHMPPASKRQPSPAEIDTLAAWIDLGLPPQTTPTPPEPAPLSPEPEPIPDAPEPDPPALDRLRAALVHAQPVRQGSRLLCIDFAAAATTGTIDDDAAAALLGPLLPQVADLSLARCAVTDAIAPVLERTPHLRRLDLRGCKITDPAIAALSSHPALEELNLVGTGVTDAAVDSLLAMPALRRVYTWNTAITPEGAARLRAREGLHVEAGDLPPASPLETEPTPRLTSDAPPHDAAPNATPRADLVPTNTACPVSGKPVDPRYTIVHDGKAIGLCCPECAKAFWNDPKPEATGSTDQDH